ncbi:type II toxin-antitoxin system HipA family toxin YjjJ [Coraliomargarita sp. W4R72]
MKVTNQAILNYLKANGATPSRDILGHFSISRPTLSRRMTSAGDTILVIGQTTSTTFAARDSSVPEQPLYRINEQGKAQHIGTLIPLERGEWLLQSKSKIPSLFKGEFKDGLYPGWPWFLADLRPSGFLGRAFARRMSQLLDYDTNPENWSDSTVASALSRFGSNLLGDFIIGERALEDFQQFESVTPETYWYNGEPEGYPDLARITLEDGSNFGSSAGGEQPKFTTTSYQSEQVVHVIVKFSPPVDSPAGRRWGDLLIAEHIANQILTKHGHASARTTIYKLEDRIFLESERFDRIGGQGRRGLVSMRALDAAFVGQGSGSWIKCAQRLQKAKLITAIDATHIAYLWCFGELIANTDMHFGNLSFYLDDEFPLPLAPCYDMLPMRFRPAPSGEVPQVEFSPKLPLPENEAAWNTMRPLALEFWKLVANDDRISKEFQAIAKDGLKAIHAL